MNIQEGFKLAFTKTSTHIRDEESGLDIYLGDDSICIWGSTENKDWLTDFEFMFKHWKEFKHKGIKVHGGYLESWLRVKNEVFSKFIDKSKILRIAGFSMGGAYAQIIALDFAFEGYDVECYSFESPKIFNIMGREFFKILVKNCIATTYNKDAVPMLPPWYYAIKRIHLKDDKYKWWKLMSFKDHREFPDIDVSILK